MKFEYTGRHVEVSPPIRRHVEDHFKKLDHIFNGDSTLNTHVIIDRFYPVDCARRQK